MTVNTPAVVDGSGQDGSPGQPDRSRGTSLRPYPLRLAGPFAPAEPMATRVFYAILALALVAGFWTVNRTFWVPANGGDDQHGYLVGGKLISTNGTPKVTPRNRATGRYDPFVLVGEMWVGTDLGKEAERYYPKYPAGMPILVAAALRVGGPTWGPWLAHSINPLAMTLAVAATYLLARQIVGSFAGLMAALIFATSQVTLGLVNDPRSHGATVCCVAGGMYLLLRWWQAGGGWRAAAAGLLLGYAATMRYTEGLLLLPILLVILFNMRWTRLQSYIESGLLLAWWAIPVLALACYNLKTMGMFTGYDPTGESSGFRLKYLADNWYTLLHQLNDFGLVFIFPFALAGLAGLFWWRWKLGLLMVSWILPNLIIYGLYYWAPDLPNPDYMRFFLTGYPALCICAFFAMTRLWANASATPQRSPAGRWATVAIGLVVATALPVNLVPGITRQANGKLAGMLLEQRVRDLDTALRRVRHQDETSVRAALGGGPLADALSHTIVELLPRDQVVLAQDMGTMYCAQFTLDCDFYPLAGFRADTLRNPGNYFDPDGPQGLDPARRDYLRRWLDVQVAAWIRSREPDNRAAIPQSRLNAESQAFLNDQQRRVILNALASGRHVLLMTTEMPMGGRSTATERLRGLSDAQWTFEPVLLLKSRILPDPMPEPPKTRGGADRLMGLSYGQVSRANYQITDIICRPARR